MPTSYRRLAASVLVCIAAGVSTAVLLTGTHLTRPYRTGTGEPPTDINAQTVTFASGSGERLSAWFIPGLARRGAVLLLHPIRSDKRAMLARARFLQSEGYSLLLVDLQAHGESEGERITFGYREANGVRASIDELRRRAPGEKVGAIGVSLGAAAIVLSGADDVLSAVVLESLYPTIEEAVSDRLRIRFGAMGPLLSPLLLVQLEPALGITPSQLRPIDRMPAWRTPVLIVHGTEDRHTNLAEAQRLFTAARPPKEFLAFPGAAHVDLHAFDKQAYERKVGAFLACFLRDERCQ